MHEMSASSPAPERLQIVPVHAAGSATFVQDVRAAFTVKPYRLPSKYIYDELGSSIFEAIALLPEYYLTRAETQILCEHGWEIVRALGNPVTFLELGSGSGAKTRLLIEEALRAQRTLHYTAIDISAEALRKSAQALVDDYPGLTVTGYAADYTTLLGAPGLVLPQRVLAMFMGANLGNYDPAEADQLLKQIARSLKAGDGLLLGLDLRKEAKVVLPAYDDSIGLTAAFNKNLLSRINAQFGADFDLRAFDFVAEYDQTEGVVRSYLQAKSTIRVNIPAAGCSLSLREGERIHTESSYKYSEDQITAMAQRAGFCIERMWRDREQRFAVALLASAPKESLR